MPESLKMTVNVSLCGSIPRSQMSCGSCQSRLRGEAPFLSAPPLRPRVTTTDKVIEMAASSLVRKVSNDCIAQADSDSNQQLQQIEPPSWAVRARGEAILEPVCDSRRLHNPVDLTKTAVIRVGRSDTSDLQLLHCASSRRHAILFHHPNGSCYVVDCGSAHGTYVNGVRVKSAATREGVMPQRVRRGSLIRFGGPGAPSFILKAFSVRLTSLVESLEAKTITCKRNIVLDEEPPSSSCTLNDDSCLNSDALVSLNTRLNSVSNVSTLLPTMNGNFSLAMRRLRAQCDQPTGTSFLKKRSLMSFEEEFVHDRVHKKVKTSATPSDNISHSKESSDFAVVSPSRQKPLVEIDCTMHDDRPVVSPNPFEDDSKLLTLTTTEHTDIKSILVGPLSIPSTSSSKKSKKVGFCSQPPQVFYPPSVTPEG